jgi:hypothetical protein
MPDCTSMHGPRVDVEPMMGPAAQFYTVAAKAGEQDAPATASLIPTGV